MGLGIASVFIVGGSIVPAFADAASRNIPMPNVEYTTEDWYVKKNAHLIKNKNVSDLRNIVEFTVDTSQGIDKDTGRVWDDDDALGEKYVYANMQLMDILRSFLNYLSTENPKDMLI